MREPKYTIKNGIAFYEEPYTITYSDFAIQHLDCDSIIRDNTQYSDIVQVVAFATQETFNDRLKDILDTKFSVGYSRLRHLSLSGLDTIR